MPSEVVLPASIEACYALLRTNIKDMKQQSEVVNALAADLQSLRQECEQLKCYIYGQQSERHTEDHS